jgi:PAS domain S-box-containing protein
MNQPTFTEASATAALAEATDAKNRDQPEGGTEVGAALCVTEADEGPGELTAEIDWTKADWLLPTVRAGAVVVLVFQSLYLATDWRWIGARHAAVLPLHLFSILNIAIFLRLSQIRAYQGRVPQILLGSCTLLFATTAALAILTLDDTPLTMVETIGMLGLAAVVPWNWRWQAALAIAGVVSMAVFTLLRPTADPHLAYNWLAVVSAAGVAHYGALSGERYRREIASRIMALRASHRELLAESAKREAIAASNARVDRQLRESEAKLRKIFETSTDAITISRLSDGRYLDFNEGFKAIGYSREELLGRTAGDLGLWADSGQLRGFLHKLKADGAVTNMEVAVRTKSGAARPLPGLGHDRRDERRGLHHLNLPGHHHD